MSMPTILAISGLDPCAGAGLLADARVAAELGVRLVGVVTATTVQDTTGVRAVRAALAKIVREQLRALLADVEVDVVKIGMLGDERVGVAVARILLDARAPIVWDPVLAPTRGGVPLFNGDPARVARDLLPQARIVTPNLAEASVLAGLPVGTIADMRRAAKTLREAGARAVLVKGGHLPGPRALDLLSDGDAVTVLEGERIDAGPVHGTGCVLSTALACGLATGLSLPEACARAKDFVTARLANALRVGRGARCLV